MWIRSFVSGDYFAQITAVKDSKESGSGAGISFVLMQNDLECKRVSQYLLKAAIFNWFSKNNLYPIIVCLDENAHQLKTQLQSITLPSNLSVPRCSIIDCFSDPLNWRKRPQPPLDNSAIRFYTFSDMKNLKALQQQIQRAMDGCPSTSTSIVLIDSLSTLLHLHPYNTVAKFLENVATTITNVGIVSTIHTDCHEEQVIKNFEYISTATVALSNYKTDGMSCSIVHKRRGGKVHSARENYDITTQGLELAEVESITTPSEPIASSEKSKPKMEATFSLTLTEEEKQARENVVLPYTNVKTKTIDETEIYEEGEEYEDPDEDLDI